MFYIYKDFDINICNVSKSIPFVSPYFIYSPGRYNLAIFLFLLKFVSAEGASRVTERFKTYEIRSQDIRKGSENLKFKWEHKLVSSLPCANLFLPPVDKTYAKK